MKVFDVFLFCYELDLLEIRLNLLDPYVDHFVISESKKTHSGIDKELGGKVSSESKKLRPVEPYKGKGIKEKGQYVLRKEGKKK